MELLNIIAIIITLAAVFSYVNHRYLKLPTTIGVMVIALFISLILILVDKLGWGQFDQNARMLLENIDFSDTLLHGMLSFLLFAGALHVNINDLAKQKWIIISLASLGVIFSTFLIGVFTWLILGVLNIDIRLIYCLLFGALISPTDPIAVLGLLKTAGIPKSLETKITGEALFNDGIGVVIFLVLLDIARGGHDISGSHILLLFATETVGGVIYGLAIGALAYWMLKSVDNYQVEVLLTLALVIGGYTLAMALHLSGPIAIVIAGLLIGNHGRVLAMSENTREHLDAFWELVDEILNVVLFLLIGLEVLVLTLTLNYLLAALMIIPLVLLVRFIVVYIPVTLLKRLREFSPNAVKIMTWGALRGGISVALALSLPAGPERSVILTITYIVVVFSILVQGLTISRFATKSSEQKAGSPI
ncbi:sodium:proton antiporter [Desulfobacterota bacterium AH_259_B03_O07]|nr:sodium:proton antiporter [Desulfobacterota bacterium AH_259_B03_O07]